MRDAELALMISSRICHDLVSPVGAVVNGIDLIREIGTGDFAEELSMIGQSASRASALLQFYRIAFGAAVNRDAPITRPVLQSQAGQMIASARIALDWPDCAGPPLAQPEARLLFQLLMCARAMIGMRGTARVTLDPAASFPMTVAIRPHGNGRGGVAELNRVMIERMKTPCDGAALDPRVVEFTLVRSSADALGADLSVEESPGLVVVRATRS